MESSIKKCGRRVWLSVLLALVVFQNARASTENTWQSIACDRAVSFSLIEPGQTALSDGPRPLIVYLKNLAAPRVGTEGDKTILADFLKKGYVVAVLDYAGHIQSRVPFLNRDISKLRDEIQRGTSSIFQEIAALSGSPKIDRTRIYIIPAGCRLTRDVVFYEDAGANAATPRTLAMDIIYPSRPERPVGTLLEFSCDNKDRMGNFSMSFCSDTILEGMATEGFAVAMADHPVAPPYKGFDAMPDCAWKIKAAVRTLRAEGAALGLNGNIVPMGFSRGSGMALMLVTTEGISQFEKGGRNPDASSSVQGAIMMAGRFTYMDLLPGDKMLRRYTQAWGARESEPGAAEWKRHGALDYLETKTRVPLFLTINSTEGEEYQHQMRLLRKRLAVLRCDEIFMMEQEPRGHKMPLDPAILMAMSEYLRRQLK